MEIEKILVVDDNDDIRIVVSEMLSAIGYEVLSADSGETGLNVFLEYNFDIVLTDFRMPGIDGFDFACSIKKHSPHTPVVIMTGDDKEKINFAKNTAVDEIISKPFNLMQLDETLQNLSGKAHGI